MNPRSRFRRLLALACCAVLTALLAGAPRAEADPSAVADYLAKHPGGTVLNDNEISYADGRFVVTLVKPPTANAIADCPAGWFCFYDRTAYGYPRGRLSDCGWQSLITYGWQDRVESVYYNLPRGSVEFRDYGTPIFSVTAAAKADSDVSPFRNRATEVYRRC
jgi:hypothetical protein